MLPSFTLVTWNLNGVDEHRRDERTEAAALELLLGREPPQVVLLQEVTERMLVAHLRPHFRHAGFRVAAAPLLGEHTCVALVRRPLVLETAHVLPFATSLLGRFALELHAAWEGLRVRVITGHLESGSEASEERLRQLEVVRDRLLAWEGPAVFAGDANLRDGEASGLSGLEDAWEQVGRPADRRFTWDGARNPGVGAKARFRPDRVLLNSGLSCVGLGLVGTAPTDSSGLCPSDHFGLRVRLQASR